MLRVSEVGLNFTACNQLIKFNVADLASDEKQIFSHITPRKQKQESFVYWLIQTGNETETICWNWQLHQETFQEGSYTRETNDSIKLNTDEDEDEEGNNDVKEKEKREGGGAYGPVATLSAHKGI